MARADEHFYALIIIEVKLAAMQKHTRIILPFWSLHKMKDIANLAALI